MSKFKDQILEAKKSGILLKEIFDIRAKYRSDDALLQNEITELHKEGKINIITEFSNIQKDNSDYNVFSLRSFFNSIIFELNNPVMEVINCYFTIINSMGYSDTSKLIHESLIEYLKKDNVRIETLINSITNGNRLEFIDYLASALVAGVNVNNQTYFAKTIELTKSENIEISLRSIFTLGIINYENPASDLKKVTKEFNLIIDNTSDDRIFSFIVDSTIRLLRKHPEHNKQLEAVFIKAMGNNGPKLMLSFSNVFGFSIEKISESFLDKLIDYLKQIKPKDSNSISNIGFGLTHLLKSDKYLIAIEYLEHVLTYNKEKISIDNFGSVVDCLLHCETKKINFIITRWFLSGNLYLYKGIQDFINNDSTNQIYPEVDISQIDKKSTKQKIFLAKKAIGWLFINAPEKSAHYILSLIPISNQKETKELQKVLMYSLLLNYPGKIPQYLEKIKQTKPKFVQEVIESSITELTLYQDSIKDCLKIKELILSPSYTEIFRKYENQKMSDLYEKALKKSIFSFIPVEKSPHINLYGNKFLQNIVDASGNKSRQITPFIKRMHSFEFPWLSYIDPTGLEILLYEYKNEEYET